MNTFLGWAGIVFLILLEPVTLAYALHVAKKRGWLTAQKVDQAMKTYRGKML